MFQSARLKLTAWYLLIIMLISISFSMAIYNILTFELDRVEMMQRSRQERMLPDNFREKHLRSIDLEVIDESKNRLQNILLLINLGIFGLSSIAGYFLAGRTLKPIKEMVDEQNRFITDASHELRTPLTSLKSEIEVNLRLKDLDLKEAKKILASNLEEVNKLQYLSDNLIKLTKYQKNSSNFTVEKISLKVIVSEAIKKISTIAKNKKITIKNTLQEISLTADRQSLIEVFTILLDNAIKYSPKNTIITLSSKILDHLIQINIQDQGIGIDKKDLSHLFDRFYRSDKSRTKSDTNGYGLGLSIAKQIIDKHQGFIKVESGIGQGTTFIIQLPKDLGEL